MGISRHKKTQNRERYPSDNGNGKQKTPWEFTI
jgi:hypothetical protein